MPACGRLGPSPTGQRSARSRRWRGSRGSPGCIRLAPRLSWAAPGELPEGRPERTALCKDGLTSLIFFHSTANARLDGANAMACEKQFGAPSIGSYVITSTFSGGTCRKWGIRIRTSGPGRVESVVGRRVVLSSKGSSQRSPRVPREALAGRRESQGWGDHTGGRAAGARGEPVRAGNVGGKTTKKMKNQRDWAHMGAKGINKRGQTKPIHDPIWKIGHSC